MDLKWTLPEDASITINEAETIGAMAQTKINQDWLKGEFSSPVPRISTGIVYAIFDAVREIGQRKTKRD
jgi:hypothetical protein